MQQTPALDSPDSPLLTTLVRAKIRSVPPENQQLDSLLPAAPAQRTDERLFELRSRLTTDALELDCARLQPSVSVQLANGRIASGTLSWTKHAGFTIESSLDLSVGACQVRTSLHGVMFMIEGRIAHPGSRVTLRDPRWFTFDRRVATRIPVDKGVATLAWASPHKADGLTASEVADITPSGMQICLPRDSILPERESFPAELQIGERSISCVAELRQVWGDEGELRAGLRLTTAPDDESLADIYLAQRFPTLRPRSEVPADALCDMLQRSGYLGLRDGSAVSADWCQLDVPNSTSCDMVYEARDGSVLGHVSTTRVYSNSWLFHQLATISGHEETVECRKTLYGMATTVPNTYSGERAYGLAYFDLNKRWHRLFFEEFTHWVNDPGEALITKLDRFERADSELPPVPDARGYSAERANTSELMIATAIARSQLPRVLADALDLSPWSLRSASLTGAERASHYERSREVFVLRGPDGIEAVALCEHGSAEVSLFDILNMAYVFVPSTRRQPRVEAQLLLLSKVRAHYARRGIMNPLIVAPHGTLRADAEEGTRLVETMGVMSMSAFAMRQYQNFCHVHFSHQLGRE